ncbi:MAG: twin-arginine translocase subunit TatC [Phycisphaerae bacterium]|nr:twin-arginine translocase subunit TatC [Phycisphaerae bacterium]
MSPSEKNAESDPNTTRMSIGEHLDELRRCIARSLIALVLACVLCIWPAKFLLKMLARPVIMVLREHGQPDSFLATHPVENILVYIKVVLIFGLIISAPYIIYQLWNFVAVGLYRREKAWVSRLLLPSVGLFVTGVAFMYLFVLVASLNFLVWFSSWLPLPEANPNVIERALLGQKKVEPAESRPLESEPVVVPLLDVDPESPPPGAVWVNLSDRKLKVQGAEEHTYSVQILRDDRRALVTTHFKIGEYLSFMLVMMIAFGVAFQTPLVVIFLARAGIVPVATFRKYRKVVIFVIVVTAGILAPPDLISHLLLSGPMIVLFEIGLLLAGRRKKLG